MVTPTKPETQTLSEQDSYLWIKTTINQLRTGRFSTVDLEHLLEELETMVRSDKREIKSLLIKLLVHLLKIKFCNNERERNQGHCKGEVRTFRTQVKDDIQDSPSLKPDILEIFNECYQEARKEASDRSQLPLDTFPLPSVL